MRFLGDLVSILRLHIIAIAMAAALVFGWLFTERYLVAIALVGGLDWMIINLLNRATDIDEDLANRIPVYLGGTWGWRAAGLPENIYLVAPPAL